MINYFTTLQIVLLNINYLLAVLIIKQKNGGIKRNPCPSNLDNITIISTMMCMGENWSFRV